MTKYSPTDPTLGLDTFGDVLTDDRGAPLGHAETIRGLVEHGVLADQAGGMSDEMGDQGRRHRLPPLRLSLLPQQHQTLLFIDVDQARSERASSPTGSLDMKAQKESIQRRIIPRQTSTSGGPSSRFGYLDSGVPRAADDPVCETSCPAHRRT